MKDRNTGNIWPIIVYSLIFSAGYVAERTRSSFCYELRKILFFNIIFVAGIAPVFF